MVKALAFLTIQDIQEFIDGAEHGVILFTMGFIFNPKVVPKDRVDTLLAAFGRLPQRVIVKFDTPPEDSPPNVLVKEMFIKTPIEQINTCPILLGEAVCSSAGHFGPSQDNPLFHPLWNAWCNGGYLA